MHNSRDFGDVVAKRQRIDSNNEDSVTRINNVADSADFADRKINQKLVHGESMMTQQDSSTNGSAMKLLRESWGTMSNQNNSPFNHLKMTDDYPESSPRFQRKEPS